ncbi:T9SS type A sorting domain-containing protein [Mucilaginibacter limnophilus]|uniref:T9SS type A sorting domain-containing protein n=1 Tax=Mucilaginibacter limnophilus TaxID=1932778 RepID=A0A437MVQ1_9SPHI|nr:T9SS type A sorting domain-containing protein [Mucilaginibacter limnophilus]RVU01742.1 T9SS type A sorting domain-containing protein [Mucilaginibacter limnophilus]
MKKLLLKPGFESIFALSIVAIIGLPPLVLAQDKEKKDNYVKKRIEIRIKDGDTVVNGKNIKELKGKEKDDALAMFEPGNEVRVFTQRQPRITFERRKDAKGDVIIKRNFEAEPQFFAFDDFNNDSLHKDVRIKIDKFRGQPGFEYNFDNFHGPDVRSFKFDGFGQRNTQSFNYTNTDDEGISTHISFRVSDASTEKTKAIAGVEKAELDLNSITLVPEFLTGKTTLSFNLTAKGSADVQLKDSQGKALWSDKASSGNFSKAFTLPMNGVYYLQVKQGSNVALKRIVKED